MGKGLHVALRVHCMVRFTCVPGDPNGPQLVQYLFSVPKVCILYILGALGHLGFVPTLVLVHVATWSLAVTFACLVSHCGGPLYESVQKFRRPKQDPKSYGTCHKDSHNKDPQFVEMAL